MQKNTTLFLNPAKDINLNFSAKNYQFDVH